MDAGAKGAAARSGRRRRPFPSRLWRSLRLRPRLAGSMAAGAALFLLVPMRAALPTRLLVAWNVAVLLYVALTVPMLARADVDELKHRAAREDEGRWAILALTMLAAAMSLAGIGLELHAMEADGEGDPDKLWRFALAASTIVLSWVFTHTIFTQHYAHAFYRGENRRGEAGRETGGLAFPGGTAAPDYWDFAYFSFTIGAAAQTSDVAVTSGGMRRLVLAHTIVAFLFNTTVLALAINVGASLI